MLNRQQKNRSPVLSAELVSERFESSAPLQTAVLFLVFNRPDTTARVFEAIRKARPPRLYVAADGPRANREGEAEKVAKVRKIATEVDWPCEVKTLFRVENFGCKYAVSGAITWFFKHEDGGIILEDDCLPSQGFFHFCEAMLERYKLDRRIWMVAGFNPRYPGVTTNEYFYSENPSVWGWASWADRWAAYDVQMNGWPNERLTKYLRAKFPKYVSKYYLRSFDATKHGAINTWDYQFTWTIFKNHGLTVKPKANLISNLGIDGTHASEKDHNHFVPLGEIAHDAIANVDFVCPDVDEDYWFYRTRLYSSPRLSNRVHTFMKKKLGD